MDVLNKKSLLYIVIFLAFAISIMSYLSYFKYGSYTLDDYATIEFAHAEVPLLEACRKTTEVLYHSQGRYQPVRLCLFVAATRLIDDENLIYYNFAIHLINLLLLFLLIRKFNVSNTFSLLSILLFSLFGTYRRMDGVSTMIGGGGATLFLILLTLLFLIKTFETQKDESAKRYFFLGVSSLAYLLLIFFYEIAFPVFMTVLITAYLFQPSKKSLKESFKSRLYLLLYFVPLLGFFIQYKFYTSFKQVDYSGATIVWSWDIFTRLYAYLSYTFFSEAKLHVPTIEELIVLLLYFIAIYLSLKTEDHSASFREKRRRCFRLLIFGFVFYFSSMVLFIINNYNEPDSVMYHHTYVMTAASSILLVFFFYNIQWVFTESCRKYYLYFLLVLLVPGYLLSGLLYKTERYESDSVRVHRIRLMKHDLKTAINDVGNTDVIILKNFFYPYFYLSGVTGAFSTWFDFKKNITSGREIVSTSGDSIIFKGPLHRYAKPGELSVKHNKVQIFYVRKSDGVVLSYYDFIDFEYKTNFYQTLQVKSDCRKENCSTKLILEGILANHNRSTSLSIRFKSRLSAETFLKKVVLIELNDEEVPPGRMSILDDTLIIDVSVSTTKVNYFFFKIISTDDEFKQDIAFISLVRGGADL